MLTMRGPAIYRIRVGGRLDPSYSDRVQGMSISEVRRPDGEVETLLQGRLPDQAALSGVLNALYDLKLPIISARCMEGEGGDSSDPRSATGGAKASRGENHA